jgi:flagellar hook-basal body complex protein FliE
MQANLLSNVIASIGTNETSSLSPAASATTEAGATAAPPFSSLLKSAMANVQSLEDQASSAVQGLMNGSGVDVHQAMIATQKSDTAFEMALAVRNKAVAAYQQVMQMQF